MSNSTDYINAYLENSIGMVHDNINQILQLKTQMKLVVDGISSKDKSIEELTKELESVKKQLDATIQSQVNDNEAVNNARASVQKLQDENDSIKHKLGEFETLAKQFTDLKNEYKNKDGEVQRLTSELDNTRNSKDAEINRLSSELENTRNAKDADINRLTSELDNTRNAKDADINRLTSELETIKSSKDAEIEKLLNEINKKDDEIKKLEKLNAKEPPAPVKKPVSTKAAPAQTVTNKLIDGNDDF